MQVAATIKIGFIFVELEGEGFEASISTQCEKRFNLFSVVVKGQKRRINPTVAPTVVLCGYGFRHSPGVLVFDNKDIHLQATYIWVKAPTSCHSLHW